MCPNRYGGCYTLPTPSLFQKEDVLVSIRSSVIDVQFPQQLPEMYSQLRAGEDDKIVIEVVNHLNDKTIRGIALTPISGLARGSVVKDTGVPLQVPVGKQLLSRVFNVFGDPIDKKEEIKDVEWRSIHQPAISLAEQFTGKKGKLVSLDEALDGCDRILNDEFSDYSERSLYMLGSIDEALVETRHGASGSGGDEGDEGDEGDGGDGEDGEVVS